MDPNGNSAPGACVEYTNWLTFVLATCCSKQIPLKLAPGKRMEGLRIPMAGNGGVLTGAYERVQMPRDAYSNILRAPIAIL